MQPTSEIDYRSLFTQLIKKQMLVLGPDITLAKVGNVTGLTVDLNGDVQKIEGDPQLLLQALINQFVELSGMIVKKTMESILTSYPGMMAMAATGVFGAPSSVAQTQPAIPSQQATTANPQQTSVATSQPTTIQVVGPLEPKIEQEAKPVSTEPPPMTSVQLDTFGAPATESQKKAEPTSFSSEDMADLNKALDELSKAPLSTEKPAA